MKLQSADVLQAFEVENIETRENFVFLYDPTRKAVDMYNSSIILLRPRLELTYGELDGSLLCVFSREFDQLEMTNNPFGNKTAYGYFHGLYHRAVTDFMQPVCFIGWVDPISLEPLEE